MPNLLTLDDFDYALPEALIALHPAAPRDTSRLLRVDAGQASPFSDYHFYDLPKLLRAGDVLVFNDTRVIPARLIGQRIRGENTIPLEALLIKRLDDATWEAFAKPSKRLKQGDQLTFGEESSLHATVESKGEGGIITLSFIQSGTDLDAAIAQHGAMPLPPYILEARKRKGDSEPTKDRLDYQTLFAKRDGAVAAPTASLHFTPEVMQKLEHKGVQHAFLTLHVGAGTFLPVKEGDIAAHKMHTEWGEITPEVAARLNAIRAAGGRIIAVGTTAARLLESAADEAGQIHAFSGETDIFIRPGYRFRAVDALITNFHLPKSTLLMLVAAFCGFETMRNAYAYAINKGYRFYSYGDSSLLFPALQPSSLL